VIWVVIVLLAALKCRFTASFYPNLEAALRALKQTRGRIVLLSGIVGAAFLTVSS
jgi:hypothetical protein